MSEAILEWLLNLDARYPDGTPYDGIAIQMLYRQESERISKTFAHNQEEDYYNPIPLVTKNKEVDTYETNAYRGAIREIVSKDLVKVTGLSITELLQLDTVTYAMIVEEVERKREADLDMPPGGTPPGSDDLDELLGR